MSHDEAGPGEVQGPPYSQISEVRGDRIFVRGQDLVSELIGKASFTDTVFLLLRGRIPSDPERQIVDAVLVSLVDHGVTSSSLAARMTYRAAPDAVQGALAAGVLNAGGRMLGSMENCGAWLDQWALDDEATDDSVQATATSVVADHRSRGVAIPGFGHASHKGGDARATRILAIADEVGHRGRYVRLLEAVATELGRVVDRPVPINVTGAVAAVLLEIGIAWQIMRGFGVLSRVPGLIAHVAEERATDTVGTLVRNLQDGTRWTGIFEKPPKL